MKLLNNSAVKNEKPEFFVGFDPGVIKGCITVLDSKCSVVNELKIYRDDIHFLVGVLRQIKHTIAGSLDSTVVLAEMQSMRPGQGLSSNSKLLNNYTFTCGYFVGLGVPLFVCQATEWQQSFGLGGKQGPENCSASVEYRYRKAAHKRTAEKIFQTQLEDWQADARLIARYLQNFTLGLFEV